MIKYSILLTAFLWCSFSCQSIQVGSWSAYQGKLDMQQAVFKCRSLGMRLPTLEELKIALNEGETKAWLLDGNFYKSSTPMSEQGSPAFYILDITGEYDHQTKNIIGSAGNHSHVRCFGLAENQKNTRNRIQALPKDSMKEIITKKDLGVNFKEDKQFLLELDCKNDKVHHIFFFGEFIGNEIVTTAPLCSTDEIFSLRLKGVLAKNKQPLVFSEIKDSNQYVFSSLEISNRMIASSEKDATERKRRNSIISKYANSECLTGFSSYLIVGNRVTFVPDDSDFAAIIHSPSLAKFLLQYIKDSENDDSPLNIAVWSKVCGRWAGSELFLTGAGFYRRVQVFKTDYWEFNYPGLKYIYEKGK